MRGRRLHITWHEDATQLHDLYRREADAELCPRLHALWLLRQGHSLRATAALLGVHYVTVQQWLAWYRTGGVAEVRRHKRGNPHGPTPRLTAAQQGQLHQQASTGAFRTAREVQHWLHQQWQVRYSRGGIYSLLHRLRYKAKVPRPLSSRTTLAAQEEWKKGGC